VNDTTKKMIALAYEALRHSYSPYSHYQVGCCLLAENGKLYHGCNIENASYSTTLCAESSALGTMITDGAQHIKAVVIVNHLETACVPCGACRQRLAEFCDDDTRFLLCNKSEILNTFTLADLLPHRFNATTMKEKDN